MVLPRNFLRHEDVKIWKYNNKITQNNKLQITRNIY